MGKGHRTTDQANAERGARNEAACELHEFAQTHTREGTRVGMRSQYSQPSRAVNKRERPLLDPVKLAAAVRLRQETTMALNWVSRRLEMGPRRI